MSHLFGDILSQYLHRKHGLSQSKLAAGILQDPAIIGKMCKGQRLSGPQARARVLSIIGWLREQTVLETIVEANALLEAAGMAPLRSSDPIEAALLQQLPTSVVSTLPLFPPNLPQGHNLVLEALRPRLPLQRPPRAEHFVAREADLAKLLVDLQPGRVVTLCGPGGIGKTTLAAEAIWRLAPGNDPPERFPDGILFHSFYNQPQAALALEHIAHSFGEDPKPTPKAAAQRALAGRRFLLILDGTEVADDLRQVLDIRDQGGVLITSRQHKDAVTVHQDVTPLPPEAAITLVQAWGGGRAADKTATAQISEIVGRLPLALRLVGRYLAQNEADAGEYLAWLAQTPLAALDQGQRREQSIPLLMAHSLRQVSEQARKVLSVVGLLALAPFAGDLIDTALALSPNESQQALGTLVNYGLLRRPAETYEVTHALIHTYAREQLSPTTETVSRLASYYTTWVNTHRSQFDLLNHSRSHMIALLQRGGEHQAWAAINSLAWTIEKYLDLQGYWTDRITVMEIGLTAARALQDRRGEGGCLGQLGRTYAHLAQVPQALGYYQQALAIAQEIGDRSNEGVWLGNLGIMYARLGPAKQALGYYQQALAIAQEIGDRGNEGVWLGNLGKMYAQLGQVKQALGYYQQALAIAQEIGDRSNEGVWLGRLGEACEDLGQVPQAVSYYQQAFAIAQELGDRRGEGSCLGRLGMAYADLGQVPQAISYYQQALTIAQEIGDRGNVEIWLGSLGRAYVDLGQAKQALSYHQQAIAIARELGDRLAEGACLGNLGEAYAQLGEVEQAIDYYQQAIAIAQEFGDYWSEGSDLGNLGEAYAQLGEVEQAIDYYQQALAISQEIDDRRSQARHLGNLGTAYSKLEQVEKSVTYYQQALTIAREIGDRRGEGLWLSNLGIVYAELGQVEQAKQHGQAALYIFDEIRSPNANMVWQWLSSLNNET